MNNARRNRCWIALGLVFFVAPSCATSQETPLHRAAAAGGKELVARLLADGAEVNAKNNDGKTPLHLAAGNGHVGVTELLLAKGADARAKDDNGVTPLHWPAVQGHVKVAELLLARGAEANATSTQAPLPASERVGVGGRKEVVFFPLHAAQGHTPLHWAGIGGNREVAELLLAKGAEVNARTINGVMPLHLAAFWNSKEVAELLLARGAEVNAQNGSGKTPLDLAKTDEMKALLRKHGAK